MDLPASASPNGTTVSRLHHPQSSDNKTSHLTSTRLLGGHILNSYLFSKTFLQDIGLAAESVKLPSPRPYRAPTGRGGGWVVGEPVCVASSCAGEQSSAALRRAGAHCAQPCQEYKQGDKQRKLNTTTSRVVHPVAACLGV